MDSGAFEATAGNFDGIDSEEILLLDVAVTGFGFITGRKILGNNSEEFRNSAHEGGFGAPSGDYGLEGRKNYFCVLYNFR
jgi:hypothetical protein